MFCGGVDEAGRGCLAGPVIAAVVVLPQNYELPGFADSKSLSPEKRFQLEAEIRKQAAGFGIGLASARMIDEINILQATILAMARAVAQLPILPENLLIDGNRTIPRKILEKFVKAPGSVSQKCIVRGDSLVPAISAASILAKTFRDRMMMRLDASFPGYGFARHKGYGTREHLEKIKLLGPSRLHRLTFAGVRPKGSENQAHLWPGEK